MDAVRFEQGSGQLLSPAGHTLKLIERRTQLMNLLSDLDGSWKMFFKVSAAHR
jgi:hypothetical protein